MSTESTNQSVRPAPPQRPRSAETRRRLIRTATRLWNDKGFDDVTVEEICATAGVGRTTFYLHFESKEQLLRILARATSVGIAEELEAARATGDLDEQLDVFISGIVRRMRSVRPALTQLVIQTWRTRPDPTSGVMADAPRFADLLRQLLTEGRRRGEVDAAADTAELGEVLGALTMDVIEARAAGDLGNVRLEDSLRFRIEMVLNQYRSPNRLPPPWPSTGYEPEGPPG
jgi:TetR/AcrR family transcriptional regulator, fatty acid metabolism regulator protein